MSDNSPIDNAGVLPVDPILPDTSSPDTSPPKLPVELNHEKQNILNEILSTDQNFFITGNAGTGKSILLQALNAEFKRRRKYAVVVAPTGIAAFNVGGRTIHSTFQFPLGILTPKKLKERKYNSKIINVAREMEALIIDEISMVRADILHSIDVFLQKARVDQSPFGGVQVILFGDTAQLPPVLVPHEAETFHQLYPNRYFFSADCLEEGKFKFVCLKENFRQGDDQGFIQILDRVRENTTTETDLQILNARMSPTKNEDAIALVATNAMAESINLDRLDRLPGNETIYEAKIFGNFHEYVLAPKQLRLKKGARVMLLKNLSDTLINGSMGIVRELKPDSVVVSFDKQGDVEIEKNTWGQEADFVNEIDDDEMSLDFDFNNSVIKETAFGKTQFEDDFVGTYIQIPLLLAWATTVHKSQGKTFDYVNIDLGGKAFEHGQTYVALSRCRSLDGITLLSPIQARDIRVDGAVAEFNRQSS